MKELMIHVYSKQNESFILAVSKLLLSILKLNTFLKSTHMHVCIFPLTEHFF